MVLSPSNRNLTQLLIRFSSERCEIDIFMNEKCKYYVLVMLIVFILFKYILHDANKQNKFISYIELYIEKHYM